MEKASCIICAKNEEGRISNVLKVVHKHPLIGEIIVIDGSSKDNTVKEAKRFKGVKIIENPRCYGKTHAMVQGCKKARSSKIIFLDADLVGLSKKDVTNLITPVIKNGIDMTMSMRKNTTFWFKLLGQDYITGERVMDKKKAYEILKDVKGFGAEVKINQYYLDNNLKFIFIKCPDLIFVTKKEKVGLLRGFYENLVMCKQIFNALSFLKVMKQIFTMGYLSSKYKKQAGL